jgi:hypothetical protein
MGAIPCRDQSDQIRDQPAVGPNIVQGPGQSYAQLTSRSYTENSREEVTYYVLRNTMA